MKQENRYKLLKYNRLWLGFGYFWVLVTLYFCLTPSPPDTSAVQFGDKFIHTAGYVCLFVWFAQIYHRQHHWRIVVGLITLGIAIEFTQGLGGYRSFEVADMLANTAGVLLGWMVSATLISSVFVKFESLVFKTQKV